MKTNKKKIAIAISAAAVVSAMASVAYDVQRGHKPTSSIENFFSPYYWSLRLQASRSGGRSRNSDDPFLLRFSSASEFENWMNKNATWAQSSKSVFFNLENCRSNTSAYGGGTEYTYTCSGGYVRRSSPMGEEVCRISSVSYQADNWRNRNWNQSVDGCRTPREISESRNSSFWESAGLLALGALGGACAVSVRSKNSKNS